MGAKLATYSSARTFLFDKGQVFSNRWKLNFKHKYLTNQRSEFDVTIMETQRTFLWQNFENLCFWEKQYFNTNITFFC